MLGRERVANPIVYEEGGLDRGPGSSGPGGEGRRLGGPREDNTQSTDNQPAPDPDPFTLQRRQPRPIPRTWTFIDRRPRTTEREGESDWSLVPRTDAPGRWPPPTPGHTPSAQPKQGCQQPIPNHARLGSAMALEVGLVGLEPDRAGVSQLRWGGRGQWEGRAQEWAGLGASQTIPFYQTIKIGCVWCVKHLADHACTHSAVDDTLSAPRHLGSGPPNHPPHSHRQTK